MRPIKFRAWDKEDKIWRYYKIPGMYIEGYEWQHLENWCQYTGLKDKNKKRFMKKIY